jgi:DNA-binding cell septation regulator SpoVG
MMKIEIISLRLIEPKESGLRGFADVKLDTILIKDFRIIQRNGKPFVEGPHTTFKKDGQMMFNQIVSFPDELRTRVETAILTAYFRGKETIYEHQSK